MTKRKSASAVISGIAALATVAGLLTACGTQQTAAAPDWCPTVEGHRVECGQVMRPLVAGRPDLGEIQVGYARVQRTNANAPAAGTITPNPGGPGVALIERAGEAVAVMTGTGLIEDHDLLLIDPRGTGVSTSLNCGADEREYALATRERQREIITHCGEQLGERAAGYTSAATADDFDAVRAHLEIPKLVLYGISYGTYLMPMYAQRHPDSVQSMVLSGAYPWDFDPLNRPNAEAVSSALQRVCDRSKACDGNTAVADLKTVAARLRTTPLEVGGENPVRLDEKKLASFLFETGTSDVGAHPEQPTLLGTMPAALHAAARGDDTLLREWTVQAAAAPNYENIDLYMTVTCNDYATLWSPEATGPQREQQYRAALDQVGTVGAFSAEGFSGAQRDGGDACLGWPATTAERPAQIRAALPNVPVLVMSGDLDAITPDANGVRVAAKFANATFVSVPNTGHVPEMEPSGCAAGIIGAFVRTGATGPLDCVAAVPPIAVAPVTN
ncbi:alpha/beta fold hydrolase [Nocardia huaxiensis]|uniref:alpha/beta fold hydrolase n=1 Tax=Nocardia huaxiensis TaxID=2755382 RepID=UPI001E2B3AA6|nr:alpha/beta fold hydrolase [Nocardia huaxiensis]UFS99547.1 alpha/beta hydrolase [Nocardia huaxiensis]